MQINIKKDNLLIISDLHLGNVANAERSSLVDFFSYAIDRNCDVCINGDGLEIMQSSFTKMAKEMPILMNVMRRMEKKSLNIYYIIGNHDIVLENFLFDTGLIRFVPFLNLVSGNKRIRIEHGHLYDPFFIRFPDTYEFLTWFSGLLLQISPKFYKIWMWLEDLIFGGLDTKNKGVKGENPVFLEAAKMILKRGFDAVIFGHTHHLGCTDLDGGKKYINSGSWMVSPGYVEVSHGEIIIEKWGA